MPVVHEKHDRQQMEPHGNRHVLPVGVSLLHSS